MTGTVHLSLLSLLCLIALSGCSLVTPTVTPTAIVASTTPTLQKPTLSPTLTRIPQTPKAPQTLSPSPTIVATETPYPALQVSEAQQLAEELIATNANCELPCWWGITPGKTSWSIAQSFLYQFDQDIYSRYVGWHGPFVAEALIPVREEIFSIGQLTHRYTIAQSKVQLIEAFPGVVPTYQLSRFFTDFGQPQEIWVFSDLGMIRVENWLLIVVYYPEHGVIAIYYVKGPVSGEYLRACFPASVANALILWEPSANDDFKSIINRTGFTEHGMSIPYRTLEEATGVTIDQLFEELSASNTTFCLETPINLWGG